MKVLIIGGGGREHAIASCVAKSKKVSKIYAAPGNAGIARLAECVDISVMDFDKLVAFAKEKEIDFTIVGPDDPLVAGCVDAFEKEGMRVFGPRKNAAIIEGSKAFSKDLMKKYNIPTAAYETFHRPEDALAYLEHAPMPIVLKADGLALGKGVLICKNLEEAKAGVKELLAQLQGSKVKLCIATATDRYLVEAAFERCGVLSCFGEIFTCNEVGHGKDEPEIFEAALRFLGTKKAETVVFDDALYAIKAAKAAGFPVAAVYDSHEKNQEEIRALSDLYLKDLTQLDKLKNYLPV